MGTYVPFAKATFDALMAEMGFHEVNMPEAWEYVYEGQVRTNSRTFPYFVRIYSTVDKGTNWTRDVGEDAIRMSLHYINQGAETRTIKDHTGKKSRVVFRTKNALKRVREHARGMFLAVRDGLCHECGQEHHGVMEGRSGRNGGFLGCSRFPICKATRPLPSTSKDASESDRRMDKYNKRKPHA